MNTAELGFLHGYLTKQAAPAPTATNLVPIGSEMEEVKRPSKVMHGLSKLNPFQTRYERHGRQAEYEAQNALADRVETLRKSPQMVSPGVAGRFGALSVGGDEKGSLYTAMPPTGSAAASTRPAAPAAQPAQNATMAHIRARDARQKDALGKPYDARATTAQAYRGDQSYADRAKARSEAVAAAAPEGHWRVGKTQPVAARTASATNKANTTIGG